MNIFFKDIRWTCSTIVCSSYLNLYCETMVL